MLALRTIAGTQDTSTQHSSMQRSSMQRSSMQRQQVNPKRLQEIHLLALRARLFDWLDW